MKSNRQKIILEYPAIFEPAIEGGYNVSFPAFHGCVTFGKTFEQAQEKAEEVLGLWLEELASAKERIPVSNQRLIIADIRVSMPAKTKIYETHNG
ncbi:MAG: type II toxin-antitoxin system HicB family antitoxin [Candidatus Omnitrophica bacterium]|nr:type II toxin-antitoxin system HicB family antitoxin [Candidatus Omnitrophota bacterium]